MSIEQLDREIAEARASMERLRQRARDGDPIAALAVKRLDSATEMTLRTMTSSIFGRSSTGGSHQ